MRWNQGGYFFFPLILNSSKGEHQLKLDPTEIKPRLEGNIESRLTLAVAEGFSGKIGFDSGGDKNSALRQEVKPGAAAFF